MWSRAAHQKQIGWKVLIIIYLYNLTNFNILLSNLFKILYTIVIHCYQSLVFLLIRFVPLVVLEYIFYHTKRNHKCQRVEHHRLPISYSYNWDNLKESYNEIENVCHFGKLRQKVFRQEIKPSVL